MDTADTVTLCRIDSSDPETGTGEVVVPRDLGPVRLIRRIGRGGMGVVYLARHEMLGRDVAVKFLLNAVAGEDDPKFERFVQSTRAAAAVDHPGLTTIHHADVVQGVPYMVMRYVDGPTLSIVLERGGPLPPATAAAVLDKACAALAPLHEQGIVHRDIKSSNILLDADGGVFVTDFGLAIVGKRLTGGSQVHGLAGTPAYMAPEMFDGTVSIRSDIYALGIMAYEILAGSLPFTGAIEHLRDAHRDHPIGTECLSEHGVDEALIDVIVRATNKQTLYRYKSAEALGRACVEAVGGHEAVRDAMRDLQRRVADCTGERGSAGDDTPADDRPSTTTYFDRISQIAAQKHEARPDEQPPEIDAADSPAPPEVRLPPVVAPLAPPTVPGDLCAAPRPIAWPGVLGVIDIVLGSLGALYVGSQLASYAMLDQTSAALGSMGSVNPLAAMSVYRGPIIATSIVSSLVAVLLIFGGIGLVRRRPWGARVVRFWAVLKIVVSIQIAILTVLNTQASMAASTAQTTMPKQWGAISMGFAVVAGALGLLWFWALPVFNLIWLGRGSIRRQVRSWDAPDETGGSPGRIT